MKSCKNLYHHIYVEQQILIILHDSLQKKVSGLIIMGIHLTHTTTDLLGTTQGKQSFESMERTKWGKYEGVICLLTWRISRTHTFVGHHYSGSSMHWSVECVAKHNSTINKQSIDR